MASYGQPVYLAYTAWNTSTPGWQTGDSGNHTIYLNKDGTLAAATNAPQEVSSTHMPGVYTVLLTTAEAQHNQVQIGGVSSTANVFLTGSQQSFEQLPTAAPNASGGLMTFGTGAGQINPDGSGNVSLSSSALSAIWAVATRTLTSLSGLVVGTVTNLTNAPTAGDFTSTMKASITAAVPTAAQNATAAAADILVTPTQLLATDASGNVGLTTTALSAIWAVATRTLTTLSGLVVGTVTNLTNAPTNGDLTATMKASVTTAATAATPTVAGVTNPVTILASQSPVVHTGTAQAGAASTITLESGASAVNNFYTGAIGIVAGTGTGQENSISSYNGTTKVLTVGTAWATDPDSTSQYIIVPGSAASISGSVDVSSINHVSTSSVTTIDQILGTTQQILFSGSLVEATGGASGQSVTVFVPSVFSGGVAFLYQTFDYTVANGLAIKFQVVLQAALSSTTLTLTDSITGASIPTTTATATNVSGFVYNVVIEISAANLAQIPNGNYGVNVNGVGNPGNVPVARFPMVVAS